MYDVIIIGGGLAGAALAHALTLHGADVLVLERTTRFNDRIRGEGIYPWGVVEARALGLAQVLLDTCGCETRWWSVYADGMISFRRDLIKTAPHGAGSLNFFHPEMQEALLGAAAASGATVLRGAHVVGVRLGSCPSVSVQTHDRVTEFCARLVVGADGRRSQARSWGGFAVRRDPERLVIAGVLLKGMTVAEDSVHVVNLPPVGHTSVFPIGKQRFRAYLVHPMHGEWQRSNRRRWSPAFIAACIAVGAPDEWYARVEVAGPLATFPSATTWVPHPYNDGLVLVGDGAAAADPSWGCGLALTLRDVRVLRDHLLAEDNWDIAAHAYAAEHDQYFGALHRLESWLTTLYYESGPEADARRARVLPRLAQNPRDIPDIVGLGPEAPSDEAARRRLFGMDEAYPA